MSAILTVPYTIEPEAASRVAELGVQAELDCMLTHTCQIVPALKRINVRLAPLYDTGDEPDIAIEATRKGPYVGDYPTEWQWHRWLVNTFSPDVYRHFAMLEVYETDDAR